LEETDTLFRKEGVVGKMVELHPLFFYHFVNSPMALWMQIFIIISLKNSGCSDVKCVVEVLRQTWPW